MSYVRPLTAQGKGAVRASSYQVLLVRVLRAQKVDEPAHEALLISKVLGIRVLHGLVRLVLNQRGHQVHYGIHL